MIKKFLKHQKYRNMTRVSSSFILEEFAKIVEKTIKHFEKNGQIEKPEHKEVLKFESTALLFDG